MADKKRISRCPGLSIAGACWASQTDRTPRDVKSRSRSRTGAVQPAAPINEQNIWCGACSAFSGLLSPCQSPQAGRIFNGLNSVTGRRGRVPCTDAWLTRRADKRIERTYDVFRADIIDVFTAAPKSLMRHMPGMPVCRIAVAI